MDLKLKGETAIVTGGSAGIGLAIVQALAAEGVTVSVPGEAPEIANLVAFLASPLSSATNGAALRVEGGLLRSIV
jgi:NAD(P)-dependent dehydrogenase (short-subunit alcohol dehydrogenase family)